MRLHGSAAVGLSWSPAALGLHIDKIICRALRVSCEEEGAPYMAALRDTEPLEGWRGCPAADYPPVGVDVIALQAAGGADEQQVPAAGSI